MTASFAPRTLGRTALPVSPLGIASSYGVSGRDVERAFDHGVNYFLWGSLRRRDFARGVKNLARTHRSEMVVAIQSYTRVGWLMRFGVDRALQALGTDYVDFLGLAWWNAAPPRRILDAAMALRESGKVRHLMISMHHRPAFESVLSDYDGLMVRYNAAHAGAEREVFPLLQEGTRPGVVSFTATRWGTLLDPRFTPSGLPTPRASDCYRFALTHRSVDVCLTGPKNGAELDEALVTLERGPMDEAELEWMRKVGANVRDATKRQPRRLGADLIDRLGRLSCGKPKQLSA